MNRECKLFLDGYELKFTIEIDEDEINKMTDEEREDYIYEQAYEYARDNFEVSIS